MLCLLLSGSEDTGYTPRQRVNESIKRVAAAARWLCVGLLGYVDDLLAVVQQWLPTAENTAAILKIIPLTRTRAHHDYYEEEAREW